MAEAVLSLVIENVGPWLIAETKLLRGVDDEVKEILDELKFIQGSIKVADEKAEKEEVNGETKTWVNQLREVAYKIEDVIDTYVLHMAVDEHHRQERCHPKLFERAACWIFRLKPRHEIAQEIDQVKQRINTIKARGRDYGFISFAYPLEVGGSNRKEESRRDPRSSWLYVEEAEVVGIKSHRHQLVEWLVSGESKRTVIAVVGMGGLGKTTLAKNVYNSQKLNTSFSNKAWVTVSQSFKIDELLRTTLKEFYRERKEHPPQKIDTMEVEQLIKELQEYLKQKRYVVVFDDVWEPDFWLIVRNAFPDKGQGSRVLITTRSEDVASRCKQSSFDRTYRPQPLPEEKGLELFCKKVFFSEGEGYGSLPSELEQLSRDIVKKCEGLPLAIVAIAGMLSTKKKDFITWQELEKNFGTELLTNRHLSSMKWVLSLSYYDLPYNLKLCLMYFGMFPEDYSIRHGRLIRLWIAEGFAKGEKMKTAEQVAGEYLQALINRSLIQVSEVDIDGKIRLLRVHDLMREIILSKSEESSYGQVWEENSSGYDNGFTRRVSIHRHIQDSFLKSNNKVETRSLLKSKGKVETRSLSFFDMDNLLDPVLKSLLEAFKLLKVLDLQDAPIDHLSEQVGDLFHLRYLCIRHTKTKELPKSIGKLRNLQTLDIKCTLIYNLPTEIKRCHNLLYLIGYNYDYETDFSVTAQRGLKLKSGLGDMENLQKLYLIEVNHGITIFKELRKLKQLRKLGVTKLTTEDGKILCETVASLSYLESLEVCAKKNERLDLQFITSPPEYLQRVYLKGQLQKVPEWILKLKHIATISLMWSGLVSDPIDILKDMPNLTELVLQDAILGEELVFRATGFQKLKVLKLYDMSTLKKLTIESGALPCLGLLKLGPIPKLNTLPSGIQHLRNLVALRFYDVPNEFAVKILPNGGQDYSVIQNIQTVLFHYQIKGERYQTYTLDDLPFNS